MSGAFIGGGKAKAYLGGARVSGWLAGEQVFSRIADPFWDDVLMLLEGSAADRSNDQRPVSAVGGAAFDANGVASSLSPTRYFTVSGPAISFAANDDFTIEFNTRDQNSSTRWFVFVLGGAVGTDTENGTAGIGFNETSTTNRCAMWVNTGSGGVIAKSDWLNVTAFHEYCLERASGIVRWYRDGAVIWTSAAAITRPMNIGNPDMMIGSVAITGWSSAAGPIDFKRARLTRAARYQGASYTVPDSYTMG